MYSKIAQELVNLVSAQRNASEYVDSTGTTTAVSAWSNDSNTKLLLSSDGQSNGSTTFTDQAGGTLVAYGGIDHRTAGGNPFEVLFQFSLMVQMII